MRTWEETEQDVINHLAKNLPPEMAEGVVGELRESLSGQVILEQIVSYVRQIEVKAEYKNLAEKSKPS